MTRPYIGRGALRRRLLDLLIAAKGATVSTDDIVAVAYADCSPAPRNCRLGVANAVYALRLAGLDIRTVTKGRGFQGYQLIERRA